MRKLPRDRKSRGQAMVEYSMINWILILGLVLASTADFIPNGKTDSGYIKRTNLIEMFLDAYQHYYDSFYFVLNMPFP